jgi:hypothetical protein
MTPERQKKTSLMMSRVTAKPEAARRFLVAEKHVRFARYLRAREHNSDRRRFPRVPFSGTMRWQSGGRAGTCEVLDLSEAGAAFAVPQRDAILFGGKLSLDIKLGPEVTWEVTRGARVAEIVPRDVETCRVSVEFPPEQSNERPL